MAGYQLSGLASGFDWKPLVDQLIAASRIPQDRLRTEKVQVSQKQAALTEVTTLISDLDASLDNLKDGAGLGERTASIADSDTTWSASASDDTEAGEYVFNVSTLATSTRIDGAADIGAPISNSSTVSGVILGSMKLAASVTAGTFSVNGAQVTVATTDSLQDVFDAISTATSGAVSASYDPVTDRITLSGAGPITLGSGADTSNFLRALKLSQNGTDTVSSSANLGAVSRTALLSSAGLNITPNATGSFALNGVSIAYDTSVDSLQTLINRINASAAGVSASYDAVQDRMVLKSKATGNIGITVSESPGSGTPLIEILGLTTGSNTVAGTDAVFTVNGGSAMTSHSNILDAAAHGITGLTVTAKAPQTGGLPHSETVTVAADTSTAKKNLDAFISKFNALQTTITKYTKTEVSGGKVTRGLLADASEIIELGRQLRSVAFAEGTGLTGTITRISNLGIDFDGKNPQLKVSSATLLASQLSDQASSVQEFLSGGSGGLVQRLQVVVDAQTGTGGGLKNKSANFASRQLSLDDQIATFERRLSAERTRIEAKFIAMEQVQAQLQQQQKAFSRAFPG
jgi:flagellar hook-associated protein 2